MERPKSPILTRTSAGLDSSNAKTKTLRMARSQWTMSDIVSDSIALAICRMMDNLCAIETL